jgi:RNAse (barnase) inhibitor barstar
MNNIQLNGSKWVSKDDFYEALLRALGAPDWHGKNLDALSDSLRGGDINRINPPLAIIVTGEREMAPEASDTLRRFGTLVSDLHARSLEVSLTVKP